MSLLLLHPGDENGQLTLRPPPPNSVPCQQILSSLFFWYLQLAFPIPTPTPAQLGQADPRMDSLKTKAADLAVKAADATVSAPAGDVKELDPPKDTPFTKEELAKNDGRDDNTPIYVAIKGRVYDGQSRVQKGRLPAKSASNC